MADITVNAGGNLQTALNDAVGGDRIICEKGATFTGPFTVPTKASRVTLTSSSVLDGLLPARRLALADAPQLATITATDNSNWVLDGAGASNWTLDGLRFIPVGGLNNGILDFIGETCANNIYQRLLFDGSTNVQKRFLRCDGVNNLVKWLFVHDLHKPVEDGQGISIVRGAGPHTIYDCWINGGSECILLGGSSTSSAEHNPQDVVIEHCDLSQPLGRYKPDETSTHLAKNLFEPKNGIRVKLRYCNLFDITDSAQAATAIMITPSNQDGDSPWVRVYDVEISHCRLWNVGRFLTLTGYGYIGNGYTEENKHLYSTMQTDKIVVRHNLVETIHGRFIQAAGEVGALTVEHNTHLNSEQVDTIGVYLPNDAQCLRTGGDSGPQTYSVKTFILRDNFVQGTVTSPVGHGITGSDRDDIVQTFTAETNVFGLFDPDMWSTQYPGQTRESLATYNANFADTEDYLLAAGSIHNDAASDGTDIGWHGFDGAPVGGGGGTESIAWTSLTGTASATGNDVTGGASSGALSTQELNEDGHFEWVVPNTTSEMYIGLGTNTAYDLGMSHAWEFGAVAGLRESGTYKGETTYVAGDTFRIAVSGTTVTYLKNGTLIYTSDVAAGLPKKLDVGFFGAGGTVNDAVMTTASGGTANVMPTVNAGPDVSILTGATATLSGTVVDDGQGGTLTQTWTETSGPGTVTFGNASLAATTATFSVDGTYVLRLTASDGSLSSFDEMTVVQSSSAEGSVGASAGLATVSAVGRSTVARAGAASGVATVVGVSNVILPPSARRVPRIYIGGVDRTQFVRV